MPVDIDVTVTRPDKPGDAVPLLFVHGAWHTAWCWERFAAYFADLGHECRALSLRGHGASGNDRSLKFTRVNGYVDDVRSVVAAIRQDTGKAPVLVGHSMGGLVVQKYLETDRDIPKAVLLASVPAHGAWKATLRVARRYPLLFLQANLTWSLAALVGDKERGRWAFYSGDVDDAQLDEHMKHVQDESFLAFLDMLVLCLPRPSRVRTPLLVLGGAKDVLFSPDEIEKTARAYGAECVIFPDTPHNLIQGRTWHDVAAAVAAWVES